MILKNRGGIYYIIGGYKRLNVELIRKYTKKKQDICELVLTNNTPAL